jgi:hypothetical protein
MVANESDIIESFVRHTLAFVDHLHILFHNSYDPSQQIVERLIAERLPISFEIASSPAFRRERLGDALVRQVAAQQPCDYLLPLDADEFIVADSRTVLEAELAATPDIGALSLAWLPFVPTRHDDPDDPSPISRIRHRMRSPHPRVRKVFFNAAVLDHADVYLADGNHQLLSRQGREIPHREASQVFLAHYPVRSSQQFASKVVIGAMARRLSADFTENQSPHWRSSADDPDLTPDMPIERLSRYAIAYLSRGEPDLIEAPLSTEAGTLEYTDMVKVDAFARLRAFVDALVEAGALGGLQTGAGQSPGATECAEREEHRKLLMEVEETRRKMQLLHRHARRVREKVYRRARLVVVGAVVLSASLFVLGLLLR